MNVTDKWFYSDNENYFVRTILKLAKERDSIKVVDDQLGSPIWAEDLAETTIELIKNECNGTYHVVNSGECSWYDFAVQIINETGLKAKVMPCTTSEYPRPAKRPAYSVLSTEKLKMSLGKHLSDWRTALRSFLYDLGYLHIRTSSSD